MQILGRNFPASAFAWVLLAALGVALMLNAMGIIDLHVAHPEQAPQAPGDQTTSYVSAAERLAGADRSQPLRARLEAQYPGPLQDTTIQRWRDPVDGTVCYIYLPIAVAHAAGPAGLVQYGAANIGSISCLPGSSQH